MGNLKLKIVLTAVMLVFAIVPAVIVGAIGTFSVMGYERSAKENTLQQVGESKSAGIKQAFKSYSSIVGAIAKSEAAVDVAHGMGSADAELEAAVAADPDILDMMILDDSGTVIEAVNGSEGGVFENLPMNDQGVINMPSVSEMLNWTSYGDAIFVADPIPSDNASGEAGYVVAIVSAGPDSAVMKALSGQFVNLSGASFMIVDKNGVAVNYKQSGSINKEFAGSALQSDIAQFFDTSNSGYSDLKNSKDIKSIKGSAGGSTYFVGLAGTDVMNWRWVASADNAAFSKFSTTTNLLGWVVVAASAVVFSIASLLVIGRFLGNMNGMLKTMTEISEAEGSTDIRFKVTNRRSELGEIQTSFNELLDEVFLSEERHRTIAELSDNMLFEWDFHKERMYASKNMLAKFDIDTDSATLSNGKFKLHAGKQDIRSDNVADSAFLDSVGNIAVPLENIIDGVCVLVVYSERKAEVSLRVKVYREDLLPHLCKSSAYRTAGGSLSDAALLICECNYLCHKTPPETVALCRNPALFRHHKGVQ